MEYPRFEYQPLSPEQIDNLARSFMIKNYPDNERQPLTLTEKEEQELDQFLETASQEQKDIVDKKAQWKRKYFTYINKSASPEEKEQIEEDMEKDPEFKDYIERTQAWALAERYSMWRYGVEKAEEDPDGRIFDMDDSEIFTFFNLLESHPDVIDEALGMMSSEIHAGPYKNSKFMIRPNEGNYMTERQKLLELRDYFTGKIGEDEKDSLHNEIIDNPAFRSMFVKIQNALR